MPIEWLVPWIVGSVVLLAVLTRRLGTPPAQLDAELARRRFLDDHPGVSIEDVTVSGDGRAALVAWPGGAGLVFVAGDKLGTRKLGRGTLVAAPGAVRVEPHEFGLPAVLVHTTPDRVRTWVARA